MNTLLNKRIQYMTVHAKKSLLKTWFNYNSQLKKKLKKWNTGKFSETDETPKPFHFCPAPNNRCPPQSRVLQEGKPVMRCFATMTVQ